MVLGSGWDVLELWAGLGDGGRQQHVTPTGIDEKLVALLPFTQLFCYHSLSCSRRSHEESVDFSPRHQRIFLWSRFFVELDCLATALQHAQDTHHDFEQQGVPQPALL
jgi:hypothetical protein